MKIGSVDGRGVFLGNGWVFIGFKGFWIKGEGGIEVILYIVIA